MCGVSYRIVFLLSLFFLWLSCNRGCLGLIPGYLQHTAFELSPLIRCLENKMGEKRVYNSYLMCALVSEEYRDE